MVRDDHQRKESKNHTHFIITSQYEMGICVKLYSGQHAIASSRKQASKERRQKEARSQPKLATTSPLPFNRKIAKSVPPIGLT
jgi:hypothetical protein